MTPRERDLVKQMAGRLVGNRPISRYLENLEDLEILNDILASLNKGHHHGQPLLESPLEEWEKVEHPTFMKDFPVFSCDYQDYFPKP